jgi:putative FmdB family regulatory protein
MPIYEYKCLDCGNHIEAMQKISDEPLKTCPKCAGNLEKQWSRTGFQFKGTGWYVTDYAGKSATENSSETKSETKSENKTEAAKTSSAGESTGGEQSASKPETTSASSDDAKP